MATHEPIPTDGFGDILYVDFIDGKPHSVLTTKSGYDFNWCKRDGELLYHDAGGGLSPGSDHPISEWCNPEGTSFWAADCINLCIQRNWDREIGAYRINELATPDAIKQRGLVRLNNLENPFEDATEGYYGIEYCSICNDHLPGDSLCSHIWFGCNGMTGPGSDDGIDDIKESFVRFCAIAGITRRLRRGLVPFDIRTTQLHAVGGLGPSFVNLYVKDKWIADIGDKFSQYDESLIDAASLLFALDEQTIEANALVKAWLDEAVEAQDKRRASYQRCYVVTDGYRYATTKRRADKRRGTIGDDTPATSEQKKASRMSWREAKALADALNAPYQRKTHFVRRVRQAGDL